jgi:hypothetical protein
MCFPEAHAFEALVDLRSTKSPLTLRNRRPGDVIQPFGMQTRVRLKKYLHTHLNRQELDAFDDFSTTFGEDDQAPTTQAQNQSTGPKCPLEGRLPVGSVVIADQDEIIWVPGVGLSEKARVKDEPTHRIQWIKISPDHSNLS